MAQTAERATRHAPGEESEAVFTARGLPKGQLKSKAGQFAVPSIGSFQYLCAPRVADPVIGPVADVTRVRPL